MSLWRTSQLLWAIPIVGLLAEDPAEAQGFLMGVNPVKIEYDQLTGEGEATSIVNLQQDGDPNDPTLLTIGFSAAFQVDDDVGIEFTGWETYEFLLSLNSGAGPDVLIVDLFPDGLTISVIYGGGVVLGYPFSEIVGFVTVSTVANEWVGNSVGATDTFLPGAPPSAGTFTEQVPTYSGSMPVSWFFFPIELIPAPLPFIRGDANHDGNVSVFLDGVRLLRSLTEIDPLLCLAAGDVNGDGAVNFADPIYLFNFAFGGGLPPPAPFPDCGDDPSPVPLSCNEISC